nr:hypothetical protein [Oceanotoga teriensis]
MPIPPLTCIENMGKELIKLKDMSKENCDEILRYLCMSKLEEAKSILNELKFPPKQQSDLCGYYNFGNGR